MQLSENTLTVLKNFSTINPGLFFKKGNVLRTIAPSKSLLAEATVDENFPTDFGIYDLNQLLSILSLHKDSPEVNIDGNNVVVLGNGSRSRITYRCCDSSMVKMPPEKNLTLPSQDVQFTLNEPDFDWIMKSASVLASPNIVVRGEEGKLYIGTVDTADDAAHTDTLEITGYTGPSVYFIFKTENWKMIPGTYEVSISAKGIAHFKHQGRKIQYWVATEAKGK